MGFYKSPVIFPQIVKASWGRKLSPCFWTNSLELTGGNTMQYPPPSSQVHSTHCEGCLPRSVPQRWKACVCCLTLGTLVLANPYRDQAYGLTPLQPHASLLSWQDPKQVPQAWASWEGHRKSFSVCWIHVLKLWKTTVEAPFSIFTPEWINVGAKQLFHLGWFGLRKMTLVSHGRLPWKNLLLLPGVPPLTDRSAKAL